MPFIGNAPTAVPLTSADIQDGTITASDIADATITSGKLASGVIPSAATAFRNIIINGDMSIAQRGTSFTGVSTSGTYPVDRFSLFNQTLGTYTLSQDTDVPSNTAFGKSLKVACTTADASPAAGDYLFIRYTVEGQHLQAFKKGTANAEQFTLSFWVKNTKTGTYTIELEDADNTRTVSKSYTIDASDTWEYKTLTYPADTTGTFDNDENASLRINFGLAMGSDFTSGTLATSWQTRTNANRHVGISNFADSISNNFLMTGVQLEVGTSATDFEFLPFEINFPRCARYYQKVGINMGQYTFAPSHTDGWSGASQSGVLYLPYTFRGNATTEYSGSWTGRGGLGTDNNCTPSGTLQKSTSDGTATGHQYRLSWNANQNSSSIGTGAQYYSNASTNDLAFNAEI